MTATLAPDVFAKTSNMSACLVVVYSSCNISTPIPKKTENTNEIANGLKVLVPFKCFLKNKNQSGVSTKWKKK